MRGGSTMRFLSRFLFLALLCAVLGALSASAEIRYVDTFPEDCSGITDADVCMDQPLVIEGGNYARCIADSSRGQRCRDFIDVVLRGGQTVQGCGFVPYSAACGCDMVTLS